MYYEFYLQDGNKFSRYLVYSDSEESAKRDFLDTVDIKTGMKYKYSGNSLEDLRSHLHRYPNSNSYIIKDGSIDPVSSPSYKSESRYDKMSKKLRKSIREAISNKDVSDLFDRRDAIYDEMNEIYGNALDGIGDPKELKARWDALKAEDERISRVIKNAVEEKLGDFVLLAGNERDLFRDSKQYRVYPKKNGHGPIGESKSLKEADQSFTIEYREDGKKKYSTVKATSESEALNKFRSITKDRNVSGEKIAATETTDENSLTEATLDDYDELEQRCQDDLSDILDGREFWTRQSELEDSLRDHGYEVLDSNDEYIEISDSDGNQFTLDVTIAGSSRTISFREVSYIEESKKVSVRESIKSVFNKK